MRASKAWGCATLHHEQRKHSARSALRTGAGIRAAMIARAPRIARAYLFTSASMQDWDAGLGCRTGSADDHLCLRAMAGTIVASSLFPWQCFSRQMASL